jgi:hypothetical protein
MIAVPPAEFEVLFRNAFGALGWRTVGTCVWN